MAHILHIDSSPRGDRSISRSFSKEFITGWKAAHSGDAITYRDLGHHPVPHVDEAWIAAAYSPSDQHSPELAEAIRLSDELIDEFLAADRYVFGIPMYNLNVPSTFKAYIDQIVRIGRTFAVGANGYEGLVHGKKLLVITAQGGSFRPGSPAAAYNFHEPYVRGIFGFIGVTDATFIYADSLSMGDEVREKSLNEAEAAVKAAIADW